MVWPSLLLTVIPAKAGTHLDVGAQRRWIPASAGMTVTGFRETWMTPKQPAVYIMASAECGTLYIGVTGDLKRRVFEHREGLVEGFTSRYGIKRLVWFESHADFDSAITREKRLKKWNRVWKLELVESANPEWLDLWPELLD